MRSCHLEYKGCCYGKEEKSKLMLTGLVPENTDTLENQMKRCEYVLSKCSDLLMKNVILSNLRMSNAVLFYKFIYANLNKYLPIIYTPTVGDLCLNYHLLLDHLKPEGAFISKYDLKDKKSIHTIFENYLNYHKIQAVDIIIVTDGSRILGLGDLGINGMGIPIGKLCLYVLAAKMNPARCLPVTLDFGTNNINLKNDNLYIGIKEKRVTGSEYYNLFDNFMAAVREKWPAALVHFEDFSLNNCFNILDRYRSKYLCFNDDIQGTGVVAAAAILNALKITNQSPDACKIFFVGAGTAAMGIALQITRTVKKLHPEMSTNSIKKNIYMYDINGLLVSSEPESEKDDIFSPAFDSLNCPDLSEAYRKYFSYRKSCPPDIQDLDLLIDFIRPTVLIGLTGAKGLFSASILQKMATHNTNPIIMVLSNPISKMECDFETAMEHTKGKVIFAAGSPQKTIGSYAPTQVNNLYAFPGIGFGAFLSQADHISDDAFTAATIALQNMVSDEQLKNYVLLPPASDLSQISLHVTAAVLKQLVNEGLSKIQVFDDDYIAFVKKAQTHFDY